MNNIKSIDCFFFPFTFIDTELLKNYLVYFDRLYVLKPDLKANYENTLSHFFFEETRVLQDSGALVPLSFRDILSKAGKHSHTKVGVAYTAISYLIDDLEKQDSKEAHAELVKVERPFFEAFIPEGLIPTTNSASAQAELFRIINDIKHSPKSKGFIRDFEETFKVNILLKSVLEKRLPRLTLSSYDDVLEFRYKLRDELISFRSALFPLINEIECKAFSDHSGWLKEGNRLVDERVDQIKKKLKLSRDKFIRKSIQEGVFAGFAIYATALTGIPLPLLFCINSVKNIIDQYGDLIERKKGIVEENSISLLISI